MGSAEQKRLEENSAQKKHWRRWGPYLSERQWGTVREDYSDSGEAWNFFPYEHAISRAYRWGEDGIAGISDNHQRICFSFAFWNEKDPILKERLFGLAGGQGNHGEDVKEYYYYLDNTPTHSYMKYLYKYPQEEFPYLDLFKESQRRTSEDREYELIDTKIFDQDRYFDLFIEYAKQDDETFLIQVTAINRGDEEKKLHILPTLWFRNNWNFEGQKKDCYVKKGKDCLDVFHPELGKRVLGFEGAPEELFTENETNFEKIYSEPNLSSYVKDAFHRYVILGEKKAVNPKQEGTKACLHYVLDLKPKEQKKLRFIFAPEKDFKGFKKFDSVFCKRQKEADDFYEKLIPKHISEDLKNVERQALSGLLWTKQFYHYVVEDWLKGDDPKNPPPETRKEGRNHHWVHLYNDDILSVPDKWEYPWFASWDLAFHTIPIALVDPEFAKRQLTLLTREWYMHPNGQIPSYEWNFEEVNPPVHAWAAWRVFKMEQRRHKKEDRNFLVSIFQKLLLNFTWWVNRKDQEGKNVFQGGFLGLDNISVFNRSQDIPVGGSLTQSDATSWMGMYCLDMLTIAMELAKKNPSYEDMASKFFEHFLYIADAINYQKTEEPSLWNEEDGFYYDILHLADGSHVPLKVRSMVGLIPLLAVATIEEETLNMRKGFKRRLDWFLENRKDLCREISSLKKKGVKNRRILAFLDENRLRKILSKMLDENEFLSPFGIRSISRYHKDHPYTLDCKTHVLHVEYEPQESKSELFGGNSNWRGPVWFPLNFLIIEALQKFHYYYGEDFKVECPTGSGRFINLWEVAGEIAHRLIKIFERDKNGKRAVFADCQKFQEDPYWKDHLFFYEYFQGDDGRGLGASHQTGWSAIIAKLIQQYGEYCF